MPCRGSFLATPGRLVVRAFGAVEPGPGGTAAPHAGRLRVVETRGAVALVTGGAHRVGRAIALALAGAGCDVFVHYGTSADEAIATAEEIRSLGVRAAIGSADLEDHSAGEELIAAATEELGPVTVLVNSASGFPRDTLLTLDPETFHRTLHVTLVAPVMLTRAFAIALSEDREGVVVNITDWRTARPYPDHFSYSVAKGALDAFTRTAAVALAPRIRVNAVALGAILPPPGKDSAYLRELAGTLPLRRTGNPRLIAEAVLYLIGSDFTTGEILRVAGGAHLV